jgi:hypothetical protein
MTFLWVAFDIAVACRQGQDSEAVLLFLGRERLPLVERQRRLLPLFCCVAGK